MGKIFKILIFSVGLISCAKNNRFSNNISFGMTFTSCFQDDTISLAIDGTQIFKNVVLNSDFSTGLTGVELSKSNESNHLDLRVNGVDRDISMSHGKLLHLSVTKNDKKYFFDLQLSKGKNILIDGCEHGIKVNQWKKYVTFE